MGGNAVFNDLSAHPVSIVCQDSRDFWRAKIEHLMLTINHVARRTLWDMSAGAKPYLAGSTKFIFDDFIPTAELVKYKNSFGDIDIQIDVEKGADLMSVLNLISANECANEFQIVGWQHTVDTIVTMWYDEDVQQTFQVDFELVEFANDRPTNWSRFSRSSSWEDTCAGIKGFAHKYIFRAITAIWLREAQVQLKTKFVTKNISPIVFSPKGARVKWREIRPDVWQEIPMDEEALIKNVEDLFKLFFKVKPDAESTCEMYSYQGVVNLILTWIDKEDHLKIAAGMRNLLWGPYAQKLYRDNPARDFYEKGQAYLYLTETLGIPVEPFFGSEKYYETY
ncbi:hypothetical protein [Xanthomonas phage X1]|nr:hypothetical protein [Xanthomonas phage X1]